MAMKPEGFGRLETGEVLGVDEGHETLFSTSYISLIRPIQIFFNV